MFLCASPHQDDVKGEEDMAAKKAALLEKRLRREKEALEKKQQQELDQEQKKEAARSVPLPSFPFADVPIFTSSINLCVAHLLQVESRGGATEEG